MFHASKENILKTWHQEVYLFLKKIYISTLCLHCNSGLVKEEGETAPSSEEAGL